MKKVVIILPTYNEKDSIVSLIIEIEKQFKKLSKYVCEILVVDDESPDGTASEVKKIIKKNSNIKLISGKKEGLGRAYVRGMHYAVDKMDADILFEMDADFSHDPKLIPEFINKIENGADFVIGSRYIKGGSIPKEWGFNRKLFSFFGNLIARLGFMILKIRDWTSGYRAIKRDVFLSVNDKLFRYTGYTFQIAFLHNVIKKGYQISEVPLNFIDRKYGKSKFIPSEYIINSLSYIFNNSSFIKFIVVGTIGFSIQTIIAKTFISLGTHPGISVTIGAEAAIISNFLLNQFWTFSHKKIIGKKSLVKKFFGFNLTSVGAIIIQGSAVTISTGLLGKSVWFIAMVLSIIFLVIPYSYFMYQKFIWKD